MTDPIARPEASKDRLLYRWPGAFSADLEITCHEGEIVALVAGGQVAGLVEPGTYKIAELPFAAALTEDVAVFILSTGVHELKVRFPETFTDPASGLAAKTTFTAVVRVQLDNPVKFCTEMVIGQRPDAVDAMEGFLGYQAQRVLLSALKIRLEGELGSGAPLLQCIDTYPAAQLVVRGIEKLRNRFGEAGLQLVELQSAELSLDAADRAKLAPVTRPPAIPQAAPQPLPPGARVLVQWADGNHYPATVRQYQQGQYEVILDLGGNPVWVRPPFVKPV